MAEVAERHARCVCELTRHGFAANDVGLEIVERRAVQVAMRVRVVAQFQPGVQPHAEHGHAPFGIGRRGSRMKQLSLVHKPYGRNAVRSDGVQQFACHRGEARHVVREHSNRGRRQIIECDRDRPSLRASLRGHGSQVETNATSAIGMSRMVRMMNCTRQVGPDRVALHAVVGPRLPRPE